MAYTSLAIALQKNDEAAIRKLTTQSGWRSLQRMTKTYGQKRIADYLWQHRKTQPTMHTPNVVIFWPEGASKPQSVTVFFLWNWRDRWRLSSFNGEL